MTDFHKRSGKRRRKQDLDPLTRRRSPEENRELKRRARERQRRIDAERRPRQRSWDPHDDPEPAAPADRRRRVGGRPARAAPPPDAPALQAVVVAPGRTHLRALLDADPAREVLVRIPPAQDAHPLGRPVVGDRVSLRPEGQGAVLTDLLPRAGVLARGGPGGGRRVLAAHVDLGLLVLSAERAAFRPGLVDRARLALERGGIEPLVLLNKVDLATPAERAACRAALADQLADGLELLEVSAATGLGLPALAERVAGRCLVLFGHSGVGKSSLLNALDPAGARSTGAVRAADGKGRHTTTAGGLRVLGDGTRLIDTPGVRAFALGRVRPDELAALFPTVAALAARCRFSDCAHHVEPGCAVRRALERGELGAPTWARYLRLAAGDEG